MVGSGIRGAKRYRIPDPGSRIRIRNTAQKYDVQYVRNPVCICRGQISFAGTVQYSACDRHRSDTKSDT
jgi:hypothetical protein